MHNPYGSTRHTPFQLSTRAVDSKILRHIDGTAARTTVVASLASLMVFAVVVFSSGLYQALESLVIGYGFAMVVVAALRLFISLRFRSIYSAGPRRWRQWFAMGLLCHALLWGSFSAVVVYLNGMGYGFLLVTLYVLGVTTALAGAWMWGLIYRLVYLLVMLSPTALVLLLQQGWQMKLLGGFIIAYGIYLARLYLHFYALFWHAVARQKRHELQTAQEDALGKDTQLQILSRVSEDLRSPLNSIIGMLELLQETELDTEQKEYHLVAAQSGRLMLTQLNNVLDYSQILLGHINFAPDDFLLRDQLEQALDAYGSIAQRQGLELSGVLDSRLPRRVRGDQQRIVQVINGLLAHAIKYAEEGEVRVEISFDEDSFHDGTLSFVVSSQGEGLNAGQIDKLFGQEWGSEELANISIRSSFNLLVCRGLIEAMGGSIFAGTVANGTEISAEKAILEGEYDSQVGFRLSLPARADVSERSEWRRFLRGKSFVLVGMAAGTAESLAMELHSLDIDTQRLTQYDDALQNLRDAAREGNHRDMVVIDLWQHKPYALRLCDSILEDPSLQGCKILLLGSIEQVGLDEVLKRAESSTVQVLAKPLYRSGIREMLAHSYGLQSLLVRDDEFDEGMEERQERKEYRLLLIEDNEADQAVTKGMLSKLGYQVKAVAELDKAREILSKERMDLVLTELFLQNRSVFEWVRELRLAEEESHAERLPVVALSADTTEGMQPKCLAAGLDDYLTKPITLDALNGALRYWLPIKQKQALEHNK